MHGGRRERNSFGWGGAFRLFAARLMGRGWPRWMGGDGASSSSA